MFTARLIESMIVARRRRRAARELAGLSDYQLRDIGITRHDLFSSHPSR